MRIGTLISEEILNKDDDGNILPDKRDWGYSVRAIVNGWKITAPDDSWYNAYKGCLVAAKWAMEQPEGGNSIAVRSNGESDQR